MDSYKKEIGLLGDKLDDKYDADYVLQHIELSEDPDQIPRIIGWSGSARSGTTALLFLLAGHDEIDHVYFQPQKTLMRFGHPSLKLDPKDKLVCMKEVFLSSGKTYDPIGTLIRAGVPAEKITWIVMLRDPVQTFSSWEKHVGIAQDPKVFAFWQAHTMKLWHTYKDSQVKVIPFVYELLQDREQEVLTRLLTKAGIKTGSLRLDFDQQMIDQKLVPGQAADEEYFDHVLSKTIAHKRFVYKTNNYPVDSTKAHELRSLCQEEYEQFYNLAKKEIGL